MGLIARQSFKAATVTYIGVILGVINTIVIYPYMLSVEQYGELQFIFSSVSFIAPFLLFGFGTVLVKFFPEYNKADTTKQMFYSLIFGFVAINVVLFLLVFLVFRDSLTMHFSQENGVSRYAIWAIVAISAIQPFILLAQGFAANKGRIAIPQLFQQLIKLVLPVLVTVYFFKVLTFSQLILSVFIYFALLGFGNLRYIHSLDKIKWAFSLAKIKENIKMKPLLVFAVFSVLSSAGAVLTNQVDVIMITGMLDTYRTGLYAFSLFMANAIAVPYGLIGSISTPLISKYWTDNDLPSLNKLYKQSSSTLMVISIGMFICLWVSVDDVFALMPKGDEYKLAKYTILMLCTAKIIDMALGLNTQLISMSKNYKYLLWFLSVAVLVNIGLNLWLIPIYGIEGSAVATIFSIIIYNLLKFILLKSKYNFQPFSYKSLLILALGIGVAVVVQVIPKTTISLLNIALFSSLAGGLFYFISYKLKLSPEVNNFINKQLLRIGIKPFD